MPPWVKDQYSFEASCQILHVLHVFFPLKFRATFERCKIVGVEGYEILLSDRNPNIAENQEALEVEILLDGAQPALVYQSSYCPRAGAGPADLGKLDPRNTRPRDSISFSHFAPHQTPTDCLGKAFYLRFNCSKESLWQRS